MPRYCSPRVCASMNGARAISIACRSSCASVATRAFVARGRTRHRQIDAFLAQLDVWYRPANAVAVCLSAAGSFDARYLDTPAQ